jgi:hypothetical protein
MPGVQFRRLTPGSGALGTFPGPFRQEAMLRAARRASHVRAGQNRYTQLSRNYYQFKNQEGLSSWNNLFLPITQGT